MSFSEINAYGVPVELRSVAELVNETNGLFAGMESEPWIAAYVEPHEDTFNAIVANDGRCAAMLATLRENMNDIVYLHDMLLAIPRTTQNLDRGRLEESLHTYVAAIQTDRRRST